MALWPRMAKPMAPAPNAPPMPPARDPPLDFEGLASFLRALAYPARLELLHALRFPHTLGELRVSAWRGPREAEPRLASRPAILAHLAKLEKADLVRSEEVAQAGRRVPQYSVNTLKLYELTEELRRVSALHAGRGPAGDHTGTLSADAGPAALRGPRLVLVHGLYEGKAFSLDPDDQPAEGWVVGRRKGLPVALDYDPFVSLENTVVTHEGGAFVARDLPDSKNGTSINWARLPKGGTQVLRPGYVLGVGRSLLTFVTE